MTADRVLSYMASLAPRQFAVVGVNFAWRPHIAKLCNQIIERARQLGHDTVCHEIRGLHPDEDRKRITDVSGETELLNFLNGLRFPAFVWCENDYIARMICNAAIYLGLSIPNQIAVMGRGNSRVGVLSQPSITTLARPVEALGFTMAKLLHEWIENDSETPADCNVAPGEVLVRQSTTTSPEWPKIQQANELIRSESCDGLTVDQICRRVDLSRVTLTKYYSEHFGVTPGVAIMQAKEMRAKQMLRDSQMSVADIGAALGFSDQSKFSKFFKRQTGLTPREYRNSAQ